MALIVKWPQYKHVFLCYQIADINQNIKHITTTMLVVHLFYVVFKMKMY